MDESPRQDGSPAPSPAAALQDGQHAAPESSDTTAGNPVVDPDTTMRHPVIDPDDTVVIDQVR
jgi:hypothetical protein